MIDQLSCLTHLPIWTIWLAALFVAVLGAGRLTRVITFDDFPPTMWLRVQWINIAGDTKWEKLLFCHWCFGFWAAALTIGWFAAGLAVLWIGIAWWVIFGSLAIGYLVSILVEFDSKD